MNIATLEQSKRIQELGFALGVTVCQGQEDTINGLCERKHECQRFVAGPKQGNQSYAPYRIFYDGTCQGFYLNPILPAQRVN